MTLLPGPNSVQIAQTHCIGRDVKRERQKYQLEKSLAAALLHLHRTMGEQLSVGGWHALPLTRVRRGVDVGSLYFFDGGSSGRR